MHSYRHRRLADILREIRDASWVDDTVYGPMPVSWHPDHPCRLDAEYTKCVMWHFVVRSEWTPDFVYALNTAFAREFGLEHDIRWVGLVQSSHDDGGGPGYHAAFLVHGDDVDKISNRHRTELGFRWFSEVVRRGDGSVFPDAFVRQYAGFRPSSPRRLPTLDEHVCQAVQTV